MSYSITSLCGNGENENFNDRKLENLTKVGVAKQKAGGAVGSRPPFE